jgi:amidase
MSTITPFSTATEMIDAMNAGEVTSSELVELMIERIEQHDEKLNAIPLRLYERAREEAASADALRKAGQQARMLGLPITLKESTHVVGTPGTAGIPQMAAYEPPRDARVAAALFAEGVALLGKTNIPVALGDWQADSPVYGRTNNPWDLGRTPGGSTGGGGAALAAGMTPFEIGSDIGGSIRVPAAYCGVYGHRPSETAVPKTGSFPEADLPNPAGLMGVQGPLARSAKDLELAMEILAGPDIGEDAAWRLELPAPRHERLGDFRVAVLPQSDIVSASGEMNARVDELASFLSAKGATVKAARPDVDEAEYFHDYVRLLNAQTSVGQSREERQKRAEALRGAGTPVDAAQADGLTLDVPEYMKLLRRRAAAAQAWRAFFNEWDVVIGPMTLDAAFPHQEAVFHERILEVDGDEVPYFLNIYYPMWAIFTGLPSTAFPGGFNRSGLPLGLQAIGPYLEDRTPLRFAALLEQEWRAFEPPPGY